MQKIPVTRDGKKGSKVIIIDAHDVIRIDKKDNSFIIHTKDELYYLDISFDSIEDWLFEDGFRLIDSTNLVNMNHVSEYDSDKGIVYLGDRKNKKTKTATAARIHKEHINNLLDIIHKEHEMNKEENEDYPEDSIGQLTESQTEHELFLRSYATIRAINDRKRIEDKMFHMAYHDSVTDLPNRLLFYERLNQVFNESQESGKMFALVYLNLDRFKVINDTLGHQAGDELLRHMGAKLRFYAQEGDFVARFGGDEFIVLISNINHIDEVTSYVKRFPSMFSKPFEIAQQELFITASIGISLFPTNGADISTLIKHADTAMNIAKDKGGNMFQLYHNDMNSKTDEHLQYEFHLRKALEKNELVIHYQPLVDLSTGYIFGMESLLRWNHPQWGMIPPSDFIPLAEESGLIVPIGSWILYEACRQNQEWLNSGYGPLVISVNISVIQFQQNGFIQMVRSTLEQTGLDPALLCLEITENVAMKNVSYILNTINSLKELGVQIAIDDFGTGYSSLNYLKRFRVHKLKIDQSFIKDVTTDEDNAAIVTALIAMSKQLKIKVLAEGVETMEQLHYLKSMGCDEIQGYLFSKPLNSEQFEIMLQENKCLYHVT